MTPGQVTTQLVVVAQSDQKPSYVSKPVALFTAAGVPISFAGQTSAEFVLTGYEIAETGAVLADTDTLNEALGKLEKRVLDKTTAIIPVTGYAIAGAVAAVGATDTVNVALGKLEKQVSAKTTALIPITSYAIAGTGEALDATDTVNEALGKLEKLISDLDGRVSILEI